MKKFLLIFCQVVIITGCSKPGNEILFNIRDLAGQDAEGVTRILGVPDTSYSRTIMGHPCFIQWYNSRDMEIRHTGGRVAEVIINNPGDLLFSETTLKCFGLTPLKPGSADTGAMLLWKEIPGFKSVSFYKVGSKRSGVYKAAPDFKIYFNFL